MRSFCDAGKGAGGGAGPQMGHAGGPESSTVVDFGPPQDFPNFVSIVQTKTCVKFVFFFKEKHALSFFCFFCCVFFFVVFFTNLEKMHAVKKT